MGGQDEGQRPHPGTRMDGGWGAKPGWRPALRGAPLGAFSSLAAGPRGEDWLWDLGQPRGPWAVRSCRLWVSARLGVALGLCGPDTVLLLPGLSTLTATCSVSAPDPR